MKRTLITACMLAAAVCLGGLTTTPAQAQISISFDIGTPPPAPRHEVTPPPRPGFVWAQGFWAWEGHHHVWHDGHWMQARPGMKWHGPHWKHEGDHYRFTPGRWAPAHHGGAHPHNGPQAGPHGGPDHGPHGGPDHGPDGGPDRP